MLSHVLDKETLSKVTYLKETAVEKFDKIEMKMGSIMSKVDKIDMIST